MVRIAIFASGGGSNAEKIIQYFYNHPSIEVGLVVTNNKYALVLEIAKQNKISSCIINRHDIYNSNNLLQLLRMEKIDFLVLAGFLWLIPSNLISEYPKCIMNIHPSLLPKYGGAGMYGHHVHEAVKAANEKKSGMTVHLVNEKYDDGAIIFQEECVVQPDMNPKEIAAEVLNLEHKYYSKAIEDYIKKVFL